MPSLFEKGTTMRTINLLLLAAFAASSAHAAPPDDENALSMTADLRGMQLTSEADVRRLTRRISRLATTVCEAPGTRSTAERAAFDTCRAAAVGDAQRQVRVAIAAARSGGNTRLAAVR